MKALLDRLVLPAHPSDIPAPSYFTKQNPLVVLDARRVLSWHTGGAQIVDLASGEREDLPFKVPQRAWPYVSLLAVASDGRAVVAATLDTLVVVDDLTAKGKAPRTFPAKETPTAVGITKDWIVAVGSYVHAWPRGEAPEGHRALPEELWGAAVARDGAIAGFLYADEQKTAVLWVTSAPDAPARRVPLAPPGEGWGRLVGWSDDGQVIACGLGRTSGTRLDGSPFDASGPMDEVVLVSRDGEILGRVATPAHEEPQWGVVRGLPGSRSFLHPVDRGAFVLLDVAQTIDQQRVVIERWSTTEGLLARDTLVLAQEQSDRPVSVQPALGASFVVLNRDRGWLTGPLPEPAAPPPEPSPGKAPTARGQTAALRKRVADATLVGKGAVNKLGADLEPLVALVEANLATELCLTVEEGRLVGLKARFNRSAAGASLAPFTALRSFTLRWGNAGPVASFVEGFFDAPALRDIEFQAGAVREVPGVLREQRPGRRVVLHGPS